MQQRYKLDECHKKIILGMIGKDWKEFKSKLSKIVLQASQGPNVSRHLALHKPTEVKCTEWEEFVKDRLTKEFKVRTLICFIKGYFFFFFFCLLVWFSSKCSIHLSKSSFFYRKQVINISKLGQKKSIYTQQVVKALQD